MKRTGPLILVLLALTAAAPARAEVERTTRHYEALELQADFFVEPKRGEGAIMILLSALVEKDLETGELVERAAAGIGRCLNPDGCTIAMRSYKIVRFEVDDTLATAHLIIKRGSQRHELRFKTSFPRPVVPPLYENPNLCEGRTTTLVLDGRNAYAEGRAFGRDVATGHDVDDDLDSTESMERRIEMEQCG